MNTRNVLIIVQTVEWELVLITLEHLETASGT